MTTASTTMTTTPQRSNGAKPLQHLPSPPAHALYQGKEHKWAVKPSTRANGPLISLLPTIAVLALTIGINRSNLAIRTYSWLNTHYTPYQINAYWTFGITSAVYWAGGLIFMAMDLYPPLHSLVKDYKVQPDKRTTWKEYKTVMYIVARNRICVALPMSMAMGYWRPLSTSPPLPGAWETISTFIFCLACEEIGFYAVHRLVHSRGLYARIHKMHHQFTAPVAFASTYCTMTEHIFSNLAPIVLGVLFLRSHWSLMIMFFCSLEIGTLTTHSDYNFPGLHSSLQHDWHHYSFVENFGPTGILDGLLGTDKTFKIWLGELKRRDVTNWYSSGRLELAKATVELEQTH